MPTLQNRRYRHVPAVEGLKRNVEGTVVQACAPLHNNTRVSTNPSDNEWHDEMKHVVPKRIDFNQINLISVKYIAALWII